jgi:sugar transferase (PEP-CTERM/EpsH1 system associated)
MRVLFLSHRFPYPPTFGSKVRSFNAIRHLAREHEVTVHSMVRSAGEAAEVGGIAAFCKAHTAHRVHNLAQVAKIGAGLATPVSASEAFFHCTAMQRDINRALAQRSFDFIFVHCSAVGRYVENVTGLPKLMDFCDVDSRKWYDYVPHKPWPLNLGYRWEAWRVAAAERRVAGRFDRVTVATPGEARTLAEVGVHERVDWFPNGVDFDFFQPSTAPHDPELISFVGRMDYFPNEQGMVDFCADVWPRLKRERPALRLQIVGAEPTLRVQALARLEGVTVTGSVPDVRPFVQRSALTVVPLTIARGTQNKILESMAMGVPVVSSVVAAGGVDAIAGEHLLAAANADETFEMTLRILNDPAERTRLAQAGLARARSHHSWSSAMQRMDGIIGACLKAANGAPLPRVATASSVGAE